jgi:hypothetical protein
MIEQIRQQAAEPFAIELVTGRVIQIYDPRAVATNDSNRGTVGILHCNGAFEVFGADKIVSVSGGVHPVEEERAKKTAAKMRERFAPKN